MERFAKRDKTSIGRPRLAIGQRPETRERRPSIV